ncbi:MAG TPA: hypothetical protein VF487_04575 [Chitinophagaceae bacterium]
MRVRVIINNEKIYPLANDQPVVIPVDLNYPKVVVTDGFHFTKPLELVFKEPSYYRLDVSCAITDLQLMGGGFFLVLFYLLGFLTGIFFFKLISFVPILLFLFFYYINRKKFIRLIPARP